MELSFTPEQETFRLRVRKWIEENAPKSEQRSLDAARAWQRKLYEAGFLGAGWPKEHGGPELSKIEPRRLRP